MKHPYIRIAAILMVLLLTLVSAGFTPVAGAELPPMEESTLSSLADLNAPAGAGWAIAIAAGERHTCAVTVSGGVKCWGDNSRGQLGDGTYRTRPVPVDVVGLTSGVEAIAVGEEHSCAQLSGGRVKCWGHYYGATPQDITGLASGVQALSLFSTHLCEIAGLDLQSNLIGLASNSTLPSE